ncbi:MAG: hypothetical protein ACT4PM_00280 [Gemmatimonadales bacterium]
MRRFSRWSGVLLIGLGATACQDAAETVRPNSGLEARVGQGAGAVQQAARWFEAATPEAMAVPGAVYADLREESDKLLFGVEHPGAAAAVRAVTRRLGIPDDAVTVVQTAPIVLMATLRDRWRPTQGGIQIHFGQFLCTLGFNADDGTERSFITNSHCTNKQGGVQGTQYYQPLSSVDGTVIATEVEDPQYFRGGVCPKGRKCRYSDASRARYSDGVSSTRGVIAKTSGPNNGSITVTGSFTITSQDNTSTNFSGTVNKVGRTTGWTQGSVVGTCVTVNVSGTNITQLCQTLVQDPGGATVVGGGDSGSNVFKITSGDNVQLIGILWGGSADNELFVFSPLKNIRDELGPIIATN